MGSPYGKRLNFQRQDVASLGTALGAPMLNGEALPMESIYVREIIEATEGQLFTAGPELDWDRFRVKGVSTDSRTILSGEIFLALPGERFDGHKFVVQALKKGASAAVVSLEWANRHANGETLPGPFLLTWK